MVDIPKLEAGRLGGGFLFTLCTLGNCHAWVVGTCYDLHCGQLSRLGSGHLLRSALWAAVKLSSLGGGHLLRSALRAAVTFGWWAPITLCTVRSCHAWVVGICYALHLSCSGGGHLLCFAPVVGICYAFHLSRLDWSPPTHGRP